MLDVKFKMAESSRLHAAGRQNLSLKTRLARPTPVWESCGDEGAAEEKFLANARHSGYPQQVSRRQRRQHLRSTALSGQG